MKQKTYTIMACRECPFMYEGDGEPYCTHGKTEDEKIIDEDKVLDNCELKETKIIFKAE